MEQAIQIFIALVRSEICKTPLDPEIAKKITPEMLERLYMVSRNQDMTHIVAIALKKQRLFGQDTISKKFAKSMYSALMRYETMEHEQNRIYELFEKEKIVFVPLKGSVIRKCYTDAWMRTSCDIDILVKEEDLERAKDALVASLGYVVGRYKYHDISLYAPSGLLLELHFKILENEKNIDRNLNKVWDYVHPIAEGRFQYEMTSEYLMFHAFAHMLYHFVHGGCGVKFVTDIWLLEHTLPYEDKVIQKLCKECRIWSFVKSVRKLSKVWYEEEPYDDICLRMQSYIITGGVFGSSETKITARKTKVKGQFRYLFQRVFIPYQEFCASYPKLEKYPVLYPYYTVKRWFKIFNKQIAKSAVQEIKINRNILKKDVEELERLFKDLKL